MQYDKRLGTVSTVPGLFVISNDEILKNVEQLRVYMESMLDISEKVCYITNVKLTFQEAEREENRFEKQIRRNPKTTGYKAGGTCSDFRSVKADNRIA